VLFFDVQRRKEKEESRVPPLLDPKDKKKKRLPSGRKDRALFSQPVPPSYSKVIERKERHPRRNKRKVHYAVLGGASSIKQQKTSPSQKRKKSSSVTRAVAEKKKD